MNLNMCHFGSAVACKVQNNQLLQLSNELSTIFASEMYLSRCTNDQNKEIFKQSTSTSKLYRSSLQYLSKCT